MAGWRIELTPAAVRQLRQLRGDDLLVLRGAILALAGDSFPPSVRKLAGADLWRISPQDPWDSLAGRPPGSGP